MQSLGPESNYRIMLCGGEDCVDCGMRKVRRALDDAISAHGLEAHIEVRLTKCQDRCKDAPNLTLLPGAHAYARITPDGARQIVAQHIIAGAPVTALLHTPRKKDHKKKHRKHH